MATSTEYEFGETDVKASINTPKVSLEEVLQIGDKIFKQIKDSKVDPNNAADSDALLERLQTEHTDFLNSFPVVLRWMVQTRKYSTRAFKKYLMKHSSAKLDSRESFLRLQAEFMVLMFKEEHPRSPTNVINQYRQSIVDSLIEENRVFEEITKKVEEDLKQTKDNATEARRQLLYKYLTENKSS
jgi:hypothetical protein